MAIRVRSQCSDCDDVSDDLYATTPESYLRNYCSFGAIPEAKSVLIVQEDDGSYRVEVVTKQHSYSVRIEQVSE